MREKERGSNSIEKKLRLSKIRVLIAEIEREERENKNKKQKTNKMK